MSIVLEEPGFNKYCNGCDSFDPITVISLYPVSTSLCEECVTKLHQLLGTKLSSVDTNQRKELHISDINFHNPGNGYRTNIVEAKFNIPGEKTSLITVYTEVPGYGYIPGGDNWGVELYRGKNYVLESHAPSWSRNYRNGLGVPKKYDKILDYLKKLHRREYGSNL